MLQTLAIRDFVIVDQLMLEFHSGFSALTGETGAGKSIMIDALALALGARGESGLIRQGAERAEITATFDIASLTSLQSWLHDQALEGEESTLIVRRMLYADGKSRAFINGTAVTLQQLREAGESLVDIYSQHAHHSLLKSSMQRQVLDDFAGVAPLAKQVAEAFPRWQHLLRQRQEAEENAEKYALELAELRDQVRELKAVALSPDEWELLQQDHKKLSNSAELLTGVEAVCQLLDQDDQAILSQLSALQHRLQSLLEFDEALIVIADSIDSVIIQTEDISRQLNRYLQRAELDPDRLAEVELQMQAMMTAARKYRTRPELLAGLSAESQARMQTLSLMSADSALVEQESAAKERFNTLANQLSNERRVAAKALSEAVTAEMQRLSLSGGKFEVQLSVQSPAASGLEMVEFLVAGHAGVEPRPLSKVASGGELSRISLAIRVITASQVDVPTMIFDEVDVGIGGAVAEVVGRLLQALGKQRQVLVITHLPQVASCAHIHYQVVKTQREGKTSSQILELTAEARVNEIARMLGGVTLTEATLQHAQEMLNAATL